MRSILFFACLSCLFVQMAYAADEDTLIKKRATSVYQEILSPLCPGRSLNDCPSSKAHELKDEILVQLKGGVPEQEVLEGVFAKFGDQYRAIPKSEGFGKMVWIAPLAFFSSGLLIAAIVVNKRRQSHRGAAVLPSPSSGVGQPLSPEAKAEVERELAALDQGR